MKKSKFPTTEKEVIEFEKKHKNNYVEPKEFTSIDDITIENGAVHALEGSHNTYSNIRG